MGKIPGDSHDLHRHELYRFRIQKYFISGKQNEQRERLNHSKERFSPVEPVRKQKL